MSSLRSCSHIRSWAARLVTRVKDNTLGWGWAASDSADNYLYSRRVLRMSAYAWEEKILPSRTEFQRYLIKKDIQDIKIYRKKSWRFFLGMWDLLPLQGPQELAQTHCLGRTFNPKSNHGQCSAKGK